MYLCLVPVLASLVSQLGLCSVSQHISTVFNLVFFSFLVAYISVPAFACGGLAFFASDQTTVASFLSVGVLPGVLQFPLGLLHFDAYA